ncbi:MAG: 2-succinylbenzoate--CoA ligase [Solirubrobacterales bacterium]|nr:2-succinylbenzoate--CoA ligase [Solirubrobacterales bacterium]
MLVDAWLPRAARAHPERPAVNGMPYAELLGVAREAAAGLAARGVRVGDRVALALPPGTDFVVALHASWLLGAVVVPHDLRLTPEERPPADHVVERLERAPVNGTSLAATHDLGAPAFLLQTSGTSGTPKPVTLTFGNLLWSALGSAAALGVEDDDTWLCTLPLSHVGGLSIVVRSAVYGTHALVHERFDANRVLAALTTEDVTLVSLVPTTLRRLLDAGLHEPPALRCALLGGAPVPPELQRRARAAGVLVAQTYGLTETCSQVTTQAPGDPQADAGPPLFCTRVRVAEDGELHVSGPTVAGGGELATGDLGTLDAEGRLTLVGRKADTIVTGGENVAPTEVEAVLAEHPAVAEAAVHGRPDPEWGEAVVATVVLRAPADQEELRAHCAARLAAFKVPKAIAFADGLPRTRSGKLLRRAL